MESIDAKKNPDDDQDWTCKFLLVDPVDGRECWRYAKPKVCPYENITKMRTCELFKQKMRW